jgi:hypothetical protein
MTITEAHAHLVVAGFGAKSLEINAAPPSC